jgi:hypothetical protein
MLESSCKRAAESSSRRDWDDLGSLVGATTVVGNDLRTEKYADVLMTNNVQPKDRTECQLGMTSLISMLFTGALQRKYGRNGINQ